MLFWTFDTELMQTELHHLQTLRIMAEVFRRGMRTEVQLDTEVVERVFPCLDQLLLLHHAFFAAMKERRQSSAQDQGHGNYLIQRIGDVLLQQVSWSSASLFSLVCTSYWILWFVCFSAVFRGEWRKNEAGLWRILQSSQRSSQLF